MITKFSSVWLGVFDLGIASLSAATLVHPLSANPAMDAAVGRKNPDKRDLLARLVESLNSAWNQNDADRVVELFHPDATLELPTGAVTRSRSGIKQRILAEWAGKLKDTRLDYAVQEIALVGRDTALVKGTDRLDGLKVLGVDKWPGGVFRHNKHANRRLISRAEVLPKKPTDRE